MDNDILPHPETPLEELLGVPTGKIGMVPSGEEHSISQSLCLKRPDRLEERKR